MRVGIGESSRFCFTCHRLNVLRVPTQRNETESQSFRLSGFTTVAHTLWSVDMPTDLATDSHVAKVTTIDMYGREFSDTIVFEVTP